jgi:hypothetical protein
VRGALTAAFFTAGFFAAGFFGSSAPRPAARRGPRAAARAPSQHLEAQAHDAAEHRGQLTRHGPVDVLLARVVTSRCRRAFALGRLFLHHGVDRVFESASRRVMSASTPGF